MKRAPIVLLMLTLAIPASAQFTTTWSRVYGTFSLWGLSIPQPTVNGTVLGVTAGPTLSWVNSLPSFMSGDGISSPTCTVVGATASASTETSTLTKASHGCTIIQGDIVVISAATNASNIGSYEAVNYSANTIEIAELLTPESSSVKVKV